MFKLLLIVLLFPSLSLATPQYLAAPEDIKLNGSIRRETISTPLGEVKLRWPRKVESIFGRTPLRATADAARTVSRAIRSSAFPTYMQRLNLDWQIVFMDEDISESQIPYNLISNCHPGWMTPPTNIYIVAQRVASGCSGKKVSLSDADKSMTQVLIHEMGHAIEFQLLQSRFAGDRMRAEGFAAWFEQFAAKYSSILNQKEVENYFLKLAKFSVRQKPYNFVFQGTAFDYARASMYFQAIADRRGAKGVTEIYDKMREQRLGFFPAIEKSIGWRRKRLEEELIRYVVKN